MTKFLHAIIMEADEYDSDITFDEAKTVDYAIHAFYNFDTSEVFYLNDNIHSNPDDILNGIELALYAVNIEFQIEKAVVFLNEGEDLHSYLHATHAIERWINETNTVI